MTGKIWITSDTHYNHTNYCRGISKWKDKETTTRNFQTLEEMNNQIIDSINSVLEPDDTLYHLGDWSFGGIESIWNFYDKINCKNIHLILGNHDEHIRKNKILPNCSWSKIMTAQELFLSVSKIRTIFSGKQEIVLFHYPMEEWENMDRGSIHLHGHCHHKLDNEETNMKYRRMDVGIDWEQFKPYLLTDIVEEMLTHEKKKHKS